MCRMRAAWACFLAAAVLLVPSGRAVEAEGATTNTEQCDLSGCYDMPLWTCRLQGCTDIQDLPLSQRRLTGTIPQALLARGGLLGLREIHLGNNLLTGTIPDLSALSSLEQLHLFHNQLTGSIPDVTVLRHLQRVHISNNALGGVVPTSLCNVLTTTWEDDHQVSRHGRLRIGGPDTHFTCPLPPLCAAQLEEFHDTTCHIPYLEQFGLKEFEDKLYAIGVRNGPDLLNLDDATVRETLTLSSEEQPSLLSRIIFGAEAVNEDAVAKFRTMLEFVKQHVDDKRVELQHKTKLLEDLQRRRDELMKQQQEL